MERIFFVVCQFICFYLVNYTAASPFWRSQHEDDMIPYKFSEEDSAYNYDMQVKAIQDSPERMNKLISLFRQWQDEDTNERRTSGSSQIEDSWDVLDNFEEKIHEDVESDVRVENLQNVSPRQHWSFHFMPGGKKRSMYDSSSHDEKSSSFSMESYSDGETLQNTEPRKRNPNLSNAFMANGKGSYSQTPYGVSKRQHWSKGFAPGGKRSVDMSKFKDVSRAKRSDGMQEKVFTVEQPKPQIPKDLESKYPEASDDDIDIEVVPKDRQFPDFI